VSKKKKNNKNSNIGWFCLWCLNLL
jgi:hypothetical protein